MNPSDDEGVGHCSRIRVASYRVLTTRLIKAWLLCSVSESAIPILICIAYFSELLFRIAAVFLSSDLH